MVLQDRVMHGNATSIVALELAGLKGFVNWVRPALLPPAPIELERRAEIGHQRTISCVLSIAPAKALSPATSKVLYGILCKKPTSTEPDFARSCLWG